VLVQLLAMAVWLYVGQLLLNGVLSALIPNPQAASARAKQIAAAPERASRRRPERRRSDAPVLRA
jgi:hypothetical protein